MNYSDKRKMLDILRRDAADLFPSAHPIQDVRKPHVAQTVSPTLDVPQTSPADLESSFFQVPHHFSCWAQ